MIAATIDQAKAKGEGLGVVQSSLHQAEVFRVESCMYKVITRHDRGIRGYLHATLVAFDKQWNLALSDVLEVWKRKGPKKRKVPPGLGTPVPKGSAAKISPVPEITETPLGKGVWECTRYIPQLMVRGEHVVLINVVER
ncbi:LSM domain-containing protein [Phthorimaea operculella]|nr:LSM domain-containing protein [Phthorimaea operculella]